MSESQDIFLTYSNPPHIFTPPSSIKPVRLAVFFFRPLIRLYSRHISFHVRPNPSQHPGNWHVFSVVITVTCFPTVCETEDISTNHNKANSHSPHVREAVTDLGTSQLTSSVLDRLTQRGKTSLFHLIHMQPIHVTHCVHGWESDETM